MELYFDNVIIYCASKYGKYIERIYIIPKKDTVKIIHIKITKNPTDCVGNHITPWYESYRVKDEEILMEVNDIWKYICNHRGSY